MKKLLIIFALFLTTRLLAQTVVQNEFPDYIKKTGNYVRLSDTTKFTSGFLTVLPMIKDYFKTVKEDWTEYYTVPEDVIYSKFSGGSEYIIVPLYHKSYFEIWIKEQTALDKRNKDENRHVESDINPWLRYYPKAGDKDGALQINISENEANFFPCKIK